jgi:hypothetical protein
VRVIGSIAPNGSSMSNTGGSAASARDTDGAEISGSQKMDPKDAASQWLQDQGLS